MPEKTIATNGIEIWTEDFGVPANPATLLISGASAQAIRWSERLIDGLVAAGHHVIRYDNRDVGQSTCADFAVHPYTLDDLAQDAVGVLDGYGVETAHVVGSSMGGMIVQMLMLQHRARVRTATIIMSSPTGGGEGDAPAFATDDLAGPDEEFLEALAAVDPPAPTRAARIEQRITLFETLAGSAEPFDRVRHRDLATREIDRAPDYAARNNHPRAIARSSPRDRRPLLKSVDVPTLVVHGTEDRLIPYPHGAALAESIPGAELMTLERAGHEIPQVYVPDLVARIVALADRGAHP